MKCYYAKINSKLGEIIMEQSEITLTVIKSMFSNDEIINQLTLKGGNALQILDESSRYTTDIDFSIPEILDEDKFSNIFKMSLESGFAEQNYKVFDYHFVHTPHGKNFIINDTRSGDDILWGGYRITFFIIDIKKYKEIIDNANFSQQTKDTKIRNNSEKIDYKNGSTKISIDISAGEFTEPRSMKIIDGYAIYIYTTIMIVYEKARASAQQLPEYKHAKEKTRARDLYDILKLLQNHPDLSSQVLDPNNIYILCKMFKLKDVDLSLLNHIRDYEDNLRRDYEDKVLPQLDPSDIVGFDFLFSTIIDLFEKMYTVARKAEDII